MISSAPESISGVVDSFRCFKNNDIEDFMRYRAIDFERRGLCTTYIYIDMDSRRVEGYFSLAHKALKIDGLSGSKRTDIGGTKTAELAPFILIAQLGKFMSKEDDVPVISYLSGEQILSDAFAIIAKANEYILNRRILVECDNDEHLLSFYNAHDFKPLDIDRKDKKCTLYLKLEPSIA